MTVEPEVLAGDAGTLVDQLATAKSIVAYDPIEAGLNELRGRLANIVHDVTTPAGMKAARADRWECVKLRTALEAMRKRVKKPALDYERLIDSEAKRIEAAIRALESPIDADIQAEEQRIADEKAREAERERRAQEAIAARIEWIRSRPVAAVGKTSKQIGALLEQVQALPMGADLYGARLPEAIALREETIDTLRDLTARAMTQEVEAERLARERAALEEAQAKQRAEDEARARRHREEDEARAARQKHEEETAAAVKLLGDMAAVLRSWTTIAVDDGDLTDALARQRLLNEMDQTAVALPLPAGHDARAPFEHAWNIALSYIAELVEHRRRVEQDRVGARATYGAPLAEYLTADAPERERIDAADPWNALDAIRTICGRDECPPAVAITAVHEVVEDVYRARAELDAWIDKARP